MWQVACDRKLEFNKFTLQDLLKTFYVTQKLFSRQMFSQFLKKNDSEIIPNSKKKMSLTKITVIRITKQLQVIK